MHYWHFSERKLRRDLISVGAMFDDQIELELLGDSDRGDDVIGSVRVRPQRNLFLDDRYHSFLTQIPRPLFGIRGIVLCSDEGFSKNGSDTHSCHWAFFKATIDMLGSVAE